MVAALVIGIGNRLRRDDALGLQLAADAPTLARRLGTAVPALRMVPQLLPELALDLTAADRVIFADAAIAAGTGPQLRPLRTDAVGAAPRPVLLHQLTPQQLLALCAQLYGRRPRAHLLLMPAQDLGHGEGLSPQAVAGLPAARLLLSRWLLGASDA